MLFLTTLVWVRLNAAPNGPLGPLAHPRRICFLLLASGPVEVWRREEHWQRRVAQVEMTPLLVGKAAYAGGVPSITCGCAVGTRKRYRGRRRLQPPLAPTAHPRLHRQRYLKLLVDLGLVRRLQPWPGNVGKRLVRSPRLFVRDSGLLHALLDIGDHVRLPSHPVVAASWQGFAIEHLIAAAGRRWRPCHYRTQNGAQIDLVFERGGTAELAVAIRRSPTAPLPRGFRAGCEVLRPGRRYFVHGGEETGETPRGVTVIGLQALAEQLSRDAATTVTVTGLRGRAERFAQRQVS